MQKLYKGGATHLGLMLKATRNSLREYGSELDDAANRPTLTITYSPAVPEPAAYQLVGVGLVMIAGGRWAGKRRRTTS